MFSGTDNNVRIALVGRIKYLDNLKAMANALEARKISATPVSYSDAGAVDVEKVLGSYNGVICWVDPVSASAGGDEESRADCTGNGGGLDQMLRRIAAKGIHVSAHPDIIQTMGTKKVLFDTRNEPWGAPRTLYYKTATDLRQNLGQSLSSDVNKCRVLKMERGSGGRGVWRCDVIDHNQSNNTTSSMSLRVQHAGDDIVEEVVPLETMLNRLEHRMAVTGGGIVDMPFLPRVGEGIVRCYMFRDRCAGILHQLPISDAASVSHPNLNVSHSGRLQTAGLPEGKRVHPPNAPAYQDLVRTLETDWVPRLVRLLPATQISGFDQTNIAHDVLPVVWDIDFIARSPPPPEQKDLGTSGYVLCEINCSCVFPSSLIEEMAKEIAAWVKEWN